MAVLCTDQRCKSCVDSNFSRNELNIGCQEQLELHGKLLFPIGHCKCCLCSRALRTRLSVAGQQLKRIEVIEDDESEIIEAVRRMSDKYDFVVTR